MESQGRKKKKKWKFGEREIASHPELQSCLGRGVRSRLGTGRNHSIRDLEEVERGLALTVREVGEEK